MPHAPKLTKKITERRVSYLWGQYRRDNIRRGADIERKIRTNLPVRDEDISNLREEFIKFASDRNGVHICDECDVMANYYTFYSQNGRTLCENCVDEEQEAEEL